jgi:hypothetical protein
MMSDMCVWNVYKLVARVPEHARGLWDNDGVALLLDFFIAHHFEPVEFDVGPWFAVGAVGQALLLPGINVSPSLHAQIRRAFQMSVKAFDSKWAFANFKVEQIMCSLALFYAVVTLPLALCTPIETLKWMLDCCVFRGSQRLPFLTMLTYVVRGNLYQKLPNNARDKMVMMTRYIRLRIADCLESLSSDLRSGLSEQYNAHFEFVKTNVIMGAMPAAFDNELRTEDRQKREGDSATTGENVCSHPRCVNCSTKRKLLKCGRCKHAQYCGNSY